MHRTAVLDAPQAPGAPIDAVVNPEVPAEIGPPDAPLPPAPPLVEPVANRWGAEVPGQGARSTILESLEWLDKAGGLDETPMRLALGEAAATEPEVLTGKARHHQARLAWYARQLASRDDLERLLRRLESDAQRVTVRAELLALRPDLRE